MTETAATHQESRMIWYFDPNDFIQLWQEHSLTMISCLDAWQLQQFQYILSFAYQYLENQQRVRNGERLSNEEYLEPLHTFMEKAESFTGNYFKIKAEIRKHLYGKAAANRVILYKSDNLSQHPNPTSNT
ncbi:MAG: hypothetical protein QG639_151 [Patescibacteria group bacterium]|jgi:hypothetical protein|nr:hypothetical protein [Patescibacteria group bacterium]